MRSKQISPVARALASPAGLFEPFRVNPQIWEEVAGIVVPNGLIGYWRLQGNANDSSGNGHAGTLVNSPSWVAGGLQVAAGSSQSVSIGSIPALAGVSGATLCCWFNRNGVGP